MGTQLSQISTQHSEPSSCKRKTRLSNVVPSVTTVQRPVPTKKGHIISRSLLHPGNSSANPYGTCWLNKSCAYDAFFAMIFNIWHLDINRFRAVFHKMSPQYLGQLSDSFEHYISRAYNLVQVRDLYHCLLHRLNPRYFIWGSFISFLMIVKCSLKLDNTYVTSYLECASDHRSDYNDPHVLMLNIPDCGVQINSIQSWISEDAPHSNVRQSCLNCDDDVIRKTVFSSALRLHTVCN